TIQGVRIVVDGGLARVPRYEPGVGLTRLVTVRVSRASADQRRGRAGREEPGVCLRLWDEPQTASLEPHNKPEILVADLSAFVLDLAFWGSDADRLALLDPPPKPALDPARARLRAAAFRPHRRPGGARGSIARRHSGDRVSGSDRQEPGPGRRRLPARQRSWRPCRPRPAARARAFSRRRRACRQRHAEPNPAG